MDTWNRLTAVREERRERKRDWMKEGEGISQRKYIYITHRYTQQCGGGLREVGEKAGWRWAKVEKLGTSVIVQQ